MLHRCLVQLPRQLAGQTPEIPINTLNLCKVRSNWCHNSEYNFPEQTRNARKQRHCQFLQQSSRFLYKQRFCCKVISLLGILEPAVLPCSFLYFDTVLLQKDISQRQSVFLVAQQLYRPICLFVCLSVCLGVHVCVFVCVFGHATYKLTN